MGLFDGFNVDELVDASSKFEEENKNNSGEYTEIPDGTYEVSVANMEYGKSKSGKPMLKLEFVVLDGDYVNQHMWINMVTDPNSEYFELNLHNAKEILKDMVNEVDGAPEVTTEAMLRGANDFVSELFDLIEDSYEYQIEKKTKRSKKGSEFVTYKIMETYPLD